MCLAFFRSILYESNILARNKAVENLENSDGWNLNPKKLNHDEWLFTSCPKNNTNTSKNKDKEYNGTAKSKINLYSKIETAKNTIRQIKIQISCLNDSFWKEKNSKPSVFCDEYIDIKPITSNTK